ncbi:MAG TPA: histidine kinase [Bacteroidales bacterium]|jgi:PAS domain S-box-containing protein|nr:histidine kinase [Bacteroidales bacterium]
MTVNKQKNIFNIISYNDIIIGVGTSLLFLFISWIIDILNHNLSVSFQTIADIHRNNPIHWLIDLIPIIVGIVIYFSIKKRERDKAAFEKIIEQRDQDINRNARFAKRIGEGIYDDRDDSVDEDDIIGRSLIVMRDNLLANNKKEKEQNWISEGKDLISRILRMHNNIEALAYEVIVELIKYIKVIQGSFYIYEEEDRKIKNYATYAYNRKRFVNQEFKIGEGLIGQCAYEQDIVYRTEIPEDYATITSGILGNKKPSSILIVPLITEEKLQGVIEFASLDDKFQDLTIKFLKELGEIIARTLYNLRMNQKTEKLLLESQQMTVELKANEEQLRQNAEEMRATQEELEISNRNLETQIKEVENAQKRLHSLLENASEVISIYNSEIKLKYQSPSVTKILGYTPEEMMSGKDMDRLTAKGEAAMKEMFEQLLEDPHTPRAIQYTYIKKDGKKIHIETTGRNLLNDPAINGIILNSQDITERKRAEKEERMKSKMQSLSENSPDLILRMNTKGQFFYANPMVDDYIGVKSKDIINGRIEELNMEPTLVDFFKDSIKQVRRTNQKLTLELTMPTANLGERIMNYNVIPEFNENELETILFVGHDITEAKQIELEIKDKNKKISESINYAQRIQSSILPNTSIIQEYLPKSFIFYLPRDVVSGDFPWFFKKDDILYISAVDCTGHGVPGALLSFIGYFQLNNIVDHDVKYTAGQILDKLHFGVRSTLKQDRIDADARDGMDIAFCRINLKKKELQYAGAHRPLYLLRNGELIEYKGNRKAIGGIPHRNKAEKDFINHSIEIIKGDKIFIFSDGMPDQTGGPEGRKYSPQRIRNHIVENQDLTMQQYLNLFSTDFKNWKGKTKQIDDVLLIGIEF